MLLTVRQSLLSAQRHKPGQGRAVRIVALAFVWFMAVFACVEMYWSGPDSLFTLTMENVGPTPDKVRSALQKLEPETDWEVVLTTPDTVIKDRMKRDTADQWYDEIAGAGAAVGRKSAGWGEQVFNYKFLGREIVLRKWIYVVAPVFLALAWILWRILHAERVADFLIETEGEMRKVSWPARKEFVGASLVVLFLTVSVALFLWGVDVLLSEGLKALKIGY